MEHVSRLIPTKFFFYLIDGIEIPEGQVTSFIEVAEEEFEECLKQGWWTDRWIEFYKYEEEFKQLLLFKKIIKPNLYFQAHHHNTRFELDEGYWAFKEEYNRCV